MKEIVSFSKEIDFKGLVNKITKISLEHTLNVNNDDNISGDLIVTGCYKMTSVSSIDNDFSYKIPVSIEMNADYDLSNITIDIDNFTYEIIDESILKVYIDILIDNLAKKEKVEIVDADNNELVTNDELFLEEKDEENLEKEENRDDIDMSKKVVEEIKKTDTLEKEEIKEEKEEKEEIKEEKDEKTDDKESSSLFASFDNTLDTYMSYSVHIVREGDSIDTIITKYKTSKEDISEYNNLDNIKIGMKIIIPSNKNEQSK